MVITQTSTPGAQYSLPSKSSGAAYGGLPHQVFSADPGENVLLNPKSENKTNYLIITFMTILQLAFNFINMHIINIYP